MNPQRRLHTGISELRPKGGGGQQIPNTATIGQSHKDRGAAFEAAQPRIQITGPQGGRLCQNCSHTRLRRGAEGGDQPIDFAADQARQIRRTSGHAMDDLTQFRRKLVQLGQIREQTRSQGPLIGKGGAGDPIGKGGGV